MTLGQRVAVMRKGELQQVAQPQELYDRPANIFVAGLHRQPGDELLPGAYSSRRRRERFAFAVGEQRLEVDEQRGAASRGSARMSAVR